MNTAMSDVRVTDRLRALHEAVLHCEPVVCAERASLITRWHRRRRVPGDPPVVQRAHALAWLLRGKQVTIHPGELLVGNFTAARKGGGIAPELHGVAMLEDLLRFDRRDVNPMRISRADRRRLLAVLPWWLPRALALRIRPMRQALRIVREQLDPRWYLLNELGGISHVIPDFETLIRRGTRGFREDARARLAQAEPGSEAAALARAVLIVCDGLDDFARAYHDQALRLAQAEPDAARRAELERIAEACARVPAQPARTLQGGLQAILFAQIALNLESLDNSVSIGRLDRLLEDCWRRDVAAGTLDRQGAFELVGCFAVKLSEIVPVFSQRTTRFFGGMFNGQVAVVGGTTPDGDDATSELTLLILEVMDQLRTRQPNWHARIHAKTPAVVRQRIASALAAGAVSPAVYNDEVVVPSLVARGVPIEDARDYGNIGCVEPAPAGRAFFSTDAALLNLPGCLELALNGGRRFGARRPDGPTTPPAADCRSTEGVAQLFDHQLHAMVERMVADLARVERANAEHHPTPLTSMLLRGCLEAGRDASAGGARYNASGVQGVGVVEVGDSLAAIEHVVFERKIATLADVVRACASDFAGFEQLRAWLIRSPCFGNGDPRADRWVARTMRSFAASLAGRRNTRGGPYVAGYYSVTSHVAFGARVGALPSGRRAGRPWSSGISPASGRARQGPTAALLSQAALPLEVAPNGVNFNLELDPAVARHPAVVQGLVDGAFGAGCWQIQVNVLSPDVLKDARDNPGKYPGLLVRVSGYSAYFDDLSPAMKQELIDRTLHTCPG